MKIKLLNDGEYGDMEAVDFPVEVEAETSVNETGYLVSGTELIRVGATEEEWDTHGIYYFSVLQGDCEALS